MITLIGWRRRAGTASAPLLAAAIAFLLLCAVTAAAPSETAKAWSSNIGSTLVALGAFGGCLRAARHARGRVRRGWAALSLACLSWGAGQVAWTVLESGLGEQTPYPSIADIGYLGFPLLAIAAFFWLSPPATGTQVPRRLLDGLTVGCAIGLIAWLSVLGTISHDPQGLVAVVIAMIYPVGDVVLLTMAVLTITQSRGRPDGWRRLGAGALAMAWSDGAFAYLNAQDVYSSGGLADWGWWAAFCLFGVAGAHVRQPVAPPTDARGESGGLLAYATLAAAAVAVVIAYIREELDGAAGALTVLLVGLVLVRQYVALRENRALARAVQAREAQLHRLAFHDALTGLANRALFLDRLGHALDLATREPRPVSVVFCDLDGFKAVNDSLGHAIGDALLAGVADRFRAVLRSTDTLARLGGDEFAVLVEQSTDDRAVETVAQAMLRALDEPFTLDGRTVAVSASIGLATADPRRSPEQAGSLLHRADVAMYAVKASGRGGVGIHNRSRDPLEVTSISPSESGRHRAPGPSSIRPDLADPLADALDRRAVRAVFQPVVDTVSGRITALEALARWTHEGRAIGPDVFVPIAERTGLTAPLTALMLEHACEQLGRWSRQLGHGRLRVAVNISPADLADADLPGRVQRLINRHGLTRGQLALEITETEMWRPDEVLDVLHALRSIGVRLAIDDFGTGHSSLSRLAALPLDTLKLDRIFVTDIDHDESRLQFLAGLLNLARHLGLRTIAEGVERPGQLLALRRLKCDLVQGWLTGHPTTAENLTPLLLADTTMLPFGLQPRWRAGSVPSPQSETALSAVHR